MLANLIRSVPSSVVSLTRVGCRVSILSKLRIAFLIISLASSVENSPIQIAASHLRAIAGYPHRYTAPGMVASTHWTCFSDQLSQLDTRDHPCWISCGVDLPLFRGCVWRSLNCPNAAWAQNDLALSPVG